MNKNVMPLISVVGGLSKQGRSVAYSLLESNRYRVRVFTKSVESADAKKMNQMGAELIRLPLQLGRSEELAKAFYGSYGVFMLTPPVPPPDKSEEPLGKEIADAAVKAGVEHIVFSSLENVDKITKGRKFAPHFTDKANIEEYIRGLQVTSSFIMPAFFYTNFVEYYPPRFEGDTLVFPIYLPKDVKVPFVDPLSATGPAVLEIFNNPNIYSEKSLPLIGDIISPNDMVETFEKLTGQKAEYHPAYTRDEFIQYFPYFAENELLLKEILGMIEYVIEHGYFQKNRDLKWSRKINPNTLTWEQFLIKSNWQGQAQSYGRQ